MKTTFLFAAAILVSAASFGQTSTNAKASAEATVKTGAVSKTTGKVQQGEEKAVKTAKSEKEAIQEQSKNDVKQVKKSADKSANVSASEQTELSSNARVKDNNSGKDASLNERSSVSNKTSVNMNAPHTKPVKPAKVKMNTHIKAGGGVKL